MYKFIRFVWLTRFYTACEAYRFLLWFRMVSKGFMVFRVDTVYTVCKVCEVNRVYKVCKVYARLTQLL